MSPRIVTAIYICAFFLLTGCALLQEIFAQPSFTTPLTALVITQIPTETKKSTPPPTSTPTPEGLDDSQLQKTGILGNGQIFNIALSPNGEALAVTTTVGVWIYSTRDGSVLFYEDDEPPANIFGFSFVAWSPDGNLLAVGRDYTGIWIWDTDTWEMVTLLDASETYLEYPGFAWSPKGDKLILGRGWGELQFWDRATNTWKTFRGVSGEQIGVAYDSKGDALIFTDSGIIYKYWERLSSFGISTVSHLNLPEGSRTVAITAWSPNANFLILSTDYKYKETQYLIDLQNNFILKELPWSQTIAWSSSNIVAYLDYESLCAKLSISLWNSTSKQLYCLTTEADWVDALTWKSNGDLLAAGSIHGNYGLFNLSNGEFIMDLSSHLGR